MRQNDNQQNRNIISKLDSEVFTSLLDRRLETTEAIESKDKSYLFIGFDKLLNHFDDSVSSLESSSNTIDYGKGSLNNQPFEVERDQSLQMVDLSRQLDTLVEMTERMSFMMREVRYLLND